MKNVKGAELNQSVQRQKKNEIGETEHSHQQKQGLHPREMAMMNKVVDRLQFQYLSKTAVRPTTAATSSGF